MLLAHSWCFISSWWWGSDPCGLGSLGWKRCYGNTKMFGVYTYIQRHYWLLFPSASISEQVNRFSSCIFQLNPNHKCVCVFSVCAPACLPPPPLSSWNKKNVSSPLAAIQDSPWNYKSTRQGGGKRLTLAVFISESPEKTGSAMSREWDQLREEGESLWFLSLPPETLEEKSVIGMGGCKMKEAGGFQHITRSLIGGQVAVCCSSAPIPDPWVHVCGWSTWHANWEQRGASPVAVQCPAMLNKCQ